jgi:MFS-type transporter involved in bile tolerance (Atg22 family)
MICIAALSKFMHFTAHLESNKKRSQRLIIAVGVINIGLAFLQQSLGTVLYLTCVFVSLLSVVVIFTRVWYKGELANTVLGE